jgi:pSer/pThr/pTyr-binding forkhead associated (FHA) protein
MAEKVVLTVKNEIGVTEEFVFEQRTQALAGRSVECMWRLCSPFASRRHCHFDIDPPNVTVRDLGSLNGTYVNGEPIDGEYDLADGDVVQVASMQWTVHLESVPRVEQNAPEPESVGV